MDSGDIRLTVVAPFLNEEESILAFCSALREVLDHMDIAYEVILVDDGSSDQTVRLLNSLDWPAATLVRLQKNVGHQTAIDAGLHASRGAWVLTMDADLQHPPELIPVLLDAAVSASVDVAYAARGSRREDSFFKRSSARLYYTLISKLTAVEVVPNAADFRLVSRRVVDVVNQIPEEKIFRVLLPYLGFSSVTIDYVATSRVAGRSKYSLGRMVWLAVVSALSFSSRPLRWIAQAGVAVSLLALAWLGFVLISYLLGRTVEGWASVASIVLLLGGFQLLAMGVFGLYLGRLYDTSSGRPQFLVAERYSLGAQASSSEADRS